MFLLEGVGGNLRRIIKCESHTAKIFIFFRNKSIPLWGIYNNTSRTATIALESICLSWGIPAYTFYVLIDYTLIV